MPTDVQSPFIPQNHEAIKINRVRKYPTFGRGLIQMVRMATEISAIGLHPSEMD